VSFHAKGSPKVVNGVVVMGIRQQLNNIANHFKTINSFPQLKNIPIIIGESDPEGCAACGMATSPENAYRNGTMYSSYTAATFAREYILADEYHENLLGAVSWSFEFEDQPWFAGYRDLATNGVDKPVLNVFRMFGMMKGARVESVSNRMYPLKTALDSGIRREQTDIGALASKGLHSAAVMVWNYHDVDMQDPGEPVQVILKGIPAKKVKLTQYRIDDSHSNSYEVWKKMGSPQSPSTEQIAELEKAGKLQTMESPKNISSNNGSATITLKLPRQGVSLLKMDW